MLSVTNKAFLLSVVMLDVVKLSVVMMNVVAPPSGLGVLGQVVLEHVIRSFREDSKDSPNVTTHQHLFPSINLTYHNLTDSCLSPSPNHIK